MDSSLFHEIPIKTPEVKQMNVSEQHASMPETDNSAWGVIARWSVYLIAFLTPLWFLPLTISPVEENKLFFVSILAGIGFIAWLGRAIYSGKVLLPGIVPFLSLAAWILIYLFATLFSESPGISFWGPSATSFFYIFIAALVAFLASTVLSGAYARSAYFCLLASAGLAGVFFIIQTLIGIDVFPWEFAKERTFHPIGQWNVVGIFFGFIFVTLMPLLGSSYRWLFGVLAAGSLIVAAVVNFSTVWIGVGLVSIVYLAYQYSRHSATTGRAVITTMPLVLLLVSILLYLSQTMIATLFIDIIGPQLDVTPSVSSSLRIASETWKEHPLLGTGPGLFAQAWDLFKDPIVNASIYWRLRFGTASAFATTLLTTTGALGAIAFVTFIGAVVFLVFRLFNRMETEEGENRLTMALALGLLFLLYSWFVYPLTPTISVLTFLVLGLLVGRMREAGMLSFYEFSIRANSARGFIAALLIIFFMVLSVVGLYLISQKQVAAILYGRGVAVFNESGSVNEAENLFRRAVSLDQNRDQYLRAITQMSFIKLQRSVQNAENTSPENVRNSFQVALSNAISSAQAATGINPGSSLNWRLLGQVYEAIIPFVEGAADASRDAYEAAVARSPRDPLLRDDIARVYIALGDHVQARESLEEALRLKSDFATGHFRLAQIAAIKGDTAGAIRSTEQAALSAPNDVGILFQLGLLYYRENRVNEARQVLERAIDINPKYSNGRYFLGLAHAAQGNREQAIEQFLLIQELNPDNQEVVRIIANLQEGREPLAGIEPPPLERNELPVEKEGEEVQEESPFPEGTNSESENVDEE